MGSKFDEVVNKIKKNKEVETTPPEDTTQPPPIQTPPLQLPPIQPQLPTPPPMDVREADVKQEAENIENQVMQLQDNGIFRLSLLREISAMRESLNNLTATIKKLIE